MAIYGNMVVPSKAAGGALPTDNSDRNVYVPGTEVSARYSDAGGVLAAQGQQKAAEGLGNLGKGLGALAGMGMALYTRQRRIEHAEAMEAVSRLQTEYVEKQREWSQIKGANAIGMEELKSRWWDEAMPRYTEGLSDYGKRYFNLNADRVGAMADTFIQNHQEREIGQYEGQQLKLAMDAEGNMIAANPFDPAAAAASQGRIRGLIHQEAMRKGWTPEMEEQAFLAATGKAWGNAIAVRISMGDFDGAQALMQQYGASVSPEDQAKLRQQWASGKMGLIASKAAAGDIDGVHRELGAGQGLGGSFDATIAARAAQFNGRKYGGVGGFDCSAYIRTIGKDQVPAQYQDIFAGSSEHMLDRAGQLTGHLYRGGEVNAGTITSGGWLIGIAEPNAKHVRATKAERPNDIGHVAMTFMQNGVVMVTENASGRGVNSVPLAEYLDRYKGRMLFAANLNALPQGGALPGGYQGAQAVPASWVEWTKGRTSKTIGERQHNPCSIFRNGHYLTFNTDAEGFLEADKVLRGDLYAGGMTTRQIVQKWVGAGKTVPQDYWDAMKNAGLSLDEKPNLQDPQVRAKMLKGIAVGESPNGHHYSVEQLYALIAGGGQQQKAPAQGALVAPAPAGSLSDNAKAIYDLMAQQVGDGRMSRQQAEARLQEMLQNAKAKMSSSDAPVRNMAKGDYKDIQDALAAFRQGQPSQAPASAQGAQPAPAPAQSAMQQGGPAMGAGFQLTEAEQQRARNEYEPQAYASDAWKRLEALPLEKLDSGLREELRAFSGNPKMQAQVSNLLSPMVEQQKKFLVAKENQLITEWVGKIQGENYLGARNTINMAVENKQLTMEQGAKVLDARFGKREDTMETRAAAYDIKKRIDNKDIKSLAEVESACLAAHCTNAQIHECRDWFEKGGVAGHITTSHVETLWRSVMKKSSSEKMPPEVLSFVQKAVPPGKVPTEDDLKHAIQLAYTSGEGWFSGEAYKAAAEGKEDWIPKGANTDEMRAEAVRRLREDDHVKGLLSDAQINAKIRQMHGLPWGVKKDRGAK